MDGREQGEEASPTTAKELAYRQLNNFVQLWLIGYVHATWTFGEHGIQSAQE